MSCILNEKVGLVLNIFVLFMGAFSLAFHLFFLNITIEKAKRIWIKIAPPFGHKNSTPYIMKWNLFYAIEQLRSSGKM